MSARGLSRVGLLILLLSSFVLRLVPQGRYVTPDEPAWVYRSIQFLDALATADGSAMPATGHPGVTTMWLGAAGVLGRRLAAPEDSERHLQWLRCLAWLAPENGEAFRHLAPFLSWGRAAVALITTLALAALYPLLARLFDPRVAGLAVGLIALDPFFVGHSGLLHADALLATFAILSLVTALIALKEPDRRAWWALTGMLVALAILTKTPGLALLPAVLLLLVVVRLWPAMCSKGPLADMLPVVMDGLLFGVSLLVVSFVLFPALWSDPAGTFRELFSFAGSHVQRAQRAVFFAGRMTYDPGAQFYAVALLFRLSPLVFVGIAGVVLGWRHMPRDRRIALLTLFGFTLLFAGAMSVGAKKHDRYLLPVFPPLTLAAALGISTLLDRFSWGSRRLVRGSVLLFQGLLALLFVTYPLCYFNPLLGGPAVASKLLPVGWGEGAGAAARLINRLPGAEQLTVATENVPSFAALFEGRTVAIGENPDRVHLADYVAVESDVGQFRAWPVLASVPLPGGSTTLIYTNTAPIDQSDYLKAHVEEGDLILLDADLPLLRRYEGPGNLHSGTAFVDEVATAEWLQDHISPHGTTWLVSSQGASPVTRSLLRRSLEAIATEGSRVDLSSASITPFSPHLAGAAQASPFIARFGGRLRLVEAAVPEETAWPSVVTLTLRWQAETGEMADHQVVAVLRDGGGHAWSVTESLVRNGASIPTSCWESQDWADATYELALPAGIPPSSYVVEVSLYDQTRERLGVVGPDGHFQGTQVPVAETAVGRPAWPADLAALNISRSLHVPIGPLTLLGVNPRSTRVLSGDYLLLELFWQADTVPQVNHRIHLQWVDAQDQIALEAELPLSLYPTSEWQPGDRFRGLQRLHVSPELAPGFYRLVLSLGSWHDSSLGMEQVPLFTIEVLPRERQYSVPEATLSAWDVRFGEWIHSCGYDVGEVEIAPGETIPLKLCWQTTGAASRTDQDLTLFVHLLGPEGRLRGQVDRIPGNGAAPTHSWAPGQVIVDEIDLPVEDDAPPGTYRIAVGFYDVAYGDRLLVEDGTGDPSTANQAILPMEIIVQEPSP